MHLKNKCMSYLYIVSRQSDGEIFFFPSKNVNCDIIGVHKGKTICLLIRDSGRLSRHEIQFSARIIQAGGEHYTIRSYEDILEITKIRGWL